MYKQKMRLALQELHDSLDTLRMWLKVLVHDNESLRREKDTLEAELHSGKHGDEEEP